MCHIFAVFLSRPMEAALVGAAYTGVTLTGPKFKVALSAWSW